MAKDEISSLLKSVGVEKLARSGIAWVHSEDPQDVEMLLFIDEDGKRSLFLEVLRKVLVSGVTETGDTHEGEVVGRDLEKWFEKSPLEDPLVWWLKVEVERYPMRLFVVCDWRDFTLRTPDEDKFWFDLESDCMTTHIEDDPRGTREIWSTRDSR